MRLIDADITMEQLSIDFPFIEIQEKLIKSLDTVPTVQAVPIEVLEKIRADAHENAEMHENGDWYLREEWVMQIIDKYREVSE